MQDVTQLAYGQLTSTDVLIVQLVRPTDTATIARAATPAVVRILWPTQPTIVEARGFAETAAVIAKLFAGASVELSRLNARRRYL